MTSVCAVEPSVIFADDDLRPEAEVALERFRLRQVPVCLIYLGETTTEADAKPSESRHQHLPPGVHVVTVHGLRGRDLVPVMELGQQQGWRWDQSWLVTSRNDFITIANAIGLQGIAWTGPAPVPASPPLGPIIHQASDLADAPRVMVPPGGGCWHDHRN